MWEDPRAGDCSEMLAPEQMVQSITWHLLIYDSLCYIRVSDVEF